MLQQVYILPTCVLNLWSPPVTQSRSGVSSDRSPGVALLGTNSQTSSNPFQVTQYSLYIVRVEGLGSP